MMTLTVKNAEGLIGKTIRWYAPAYTMNSPYGGITIIKSIDFNKRNPLEVEIIDGDELSLAFIGIADNIAYSDSDRFVTAEILPKTCVIRHSTKGFLGENNWILNHQTAYKWATRFDFADAVKKAKSIPVKKVELCIMFPARTDFQFESYNTIAIIDNDSKTVRFN